MSTRELPRPSQPMAGMGHPGDVMKRNASLSDVARSSILSRCSVMTRKSILSDGAGHASLNVCSVRAKGHSRRFQDRMR